jgi:hypothetical protein
MNKNSVRSLFAQKTNTDFTSICIITIIWIFMVILVNPIGDFPLNDDWAYGWTVKTLLETGVFQLSDWTATNLLPQALWGTLFCLPFGFSFTALRISTLTFGLIGVIATYGLLREAKAGSQTALFGSLVVALNPIYFALSNSFHNDIPSFTLCILSVYFLAHGIRLNSQFIITTGLILSLVSILNRQSSLAILPAFGIAYLAKRGLTFETFLKSIFPTFAGIVVYLTYRYWLDITEKTPFLYGLQIEKLLETLSKGLRVIVLTYTENIFLFSIYLGLFVFPFLILYFPSQFDKFFARQKLLSLCMTFLLIAIGVVLILEGRQMPLVGNILAYFGLGPQTLEGYNSFLRQNKYLRVIIRGCWALLTLVGLVGASILFQYLILTIQAFTTRKNESSQGWLIIFLFTTAFLYLLPFGGINKRYWFDRYLILPLPLIMASILILTKQFFENGNLKPSIIIVSLATLLLLGTFTISATHDYLLWNRVRWYALENLMQGAKVSPNQIGVGEFTGWHFGNRIEICNPAFQKISKPIRVDWKDFTCFSHDADHEYTVSSVPLPGYQPQNLYPFRRWLPWREEVLYVLHKDNIN